jgi:hypothetical protein
MSTEQNSPSLERLWEDSTGEGIGIQGYLVPKLSINCAKERSDKEAFKFMEKVWKGKERYPKIKENFDKDGKLIPVKRPNYFDDIFKSINFGYSKTKETELKEKYEAKSRPFSIDRDKVVYIKDKNKAKYYRHDRITYFESLGNIVKKEAEIYPHMEVIIEKARDKIKNSPNIKSESETIKIKYEKRGSLPYFILFLFYFYFHFNFYFNFYFNF